jgi:hypothetical protein
MSGLIIEPTMPKQPVRITGDAKVRLQKCGTAGRIGEVGLVSSAPL